MKARAFLGIDWGGTYVKAGLVDPQGRVIRKQVVESRELRKHDVFLNKLLELKRRHEQHRIAAVGIGAPGVIYTRTGVIDHLGNIPGWNGYPLKQAVEKKLGIPAFVGNDANVFALAEAKLGAARNARCAVFLTLGTGLGGAIIRDGKIMEAETSACELGHVPVSLRGRRCACGGRGCIETYVGARYLMARYRQLAGNRNPVRDVSELDALTLRGDKNAIRVWQEFSLALGKFLAGMINVFNPDLIVIGGGISRAMPLFKPMLWDVIQAQAMTPFRRSVRLARAKLKNPGIVGAALLARDGLRES